MTTFTAGFYAGFMGYVPNPWMVLPFCVLLGLIALAPLRFPDWWSRQYPKVAFALAAVTLSYYLIWLHAHERVLHVAHEYVSFIVLIGSLYVVSGGIHINVKGEATPLANTTFLLIGAMLANVLGTTGASMLMIRPWIRMNRYRVTAHHIVFFIFVISNVGGCLTPIGDPPLFLGYLRGVPFWWVVEHCWPMWLGAVLFLLACFFVLDLANYRKAPKEVRAELAEPRDEWKFDGLGNIVYLAVILGAVFINRPVFLREFLMGAAATASYLTTHRQIHAANHFNFHPIREVAILFVGIFATMLPALDWLQLNAPRLAIQTPAFFYWGSGILSSCLDNAPTYLSFLSASIGLFVDPSTVTSVQGLLTHTGPDLAAAAAGAPQPVQAALASLQIYHPAAVASQSVTTEQIQTAFLLGNAEYNRFIVAISVGSVFFGANTYIGNGPNFMVKSIAEHQKVNAPGFIGYILRFALPIMLPMLALIWFIFFRR